MMQETIGALTAIRPIRSSPKAMLSVGRRSIFSAFSTWTSLSLFFSSMPYPVLTSMRPVAWFRGANEAETGAPYPALALENMH